MKSLTIHNINEKLAHKIKKLAQRNGKSINQTVKTLLQNALESGSDKEMKKSEFLDLFGVWTEEDKLEFNRNNQELNKINDQDWG